MATKTMTCEEFEEDLERARNAAANGPVFITEDGEDAFVLLTLDEYRRIGGDCDGITELLAESEAAELDFEPPSIDS